MIFGECEHILVKVQKLKGLSYKGYTMTTLNQSCYPSPGKACFDMGREEEKSMPTIST